MVFPLPCYADDRELYNQIIDIRREIARPEALVMIVTTTTVIYQWIRLDKLYKLMESFFSIF